MEAAEGTQAKDECAMDQGLGHGGRGRGGIWDSALPGRAGQFNVRSERGRDLRCALSWCVIWTPSLRWTRSCLSYMRSNWQIGISGVRTLLLLDFSLPFELSNRSILL